MSELLLKESTDEEEVVNEKEMTFLEHLEELRWRIIYSLIGIVVGTIIAWIFIDFLVDYVLLKPAKDSGADLQNLKPFGQLFLYMQVAIMVGLVISIPNIFYQFWKFISPALHKRERKYILWIVIFSSLCFLIGIAFAYFVMLPLALKFAAQFGSTAIKNQFAIDEYMSIIISVMLAAGLVFELPMISFFLSKLGILKPSFMRKFRKHAIVIIMIAAAILTPGTDPVSQIILAVPLVILYEISILISKLSQKKS
ncbi:MAG TPA: twin-arginine translocase subunit TatC [Ignavibacteriaceae bacterium]|nr:twin-arginine translocase subunit TatC [Ignavibacteriaceae bacterium]